MHDQLGIRCKRVREVSLISWAGTLKICVTIFLREGQELLNFTLYLAIIMVPKVIEVIKHDRDCRTETWFMVMHSFPLLP